MIYFEKTNMASEIIMMKTLDPMGYSTGAGLAASPRTYDAKASGAVSEVVLPKASSTDLSNQPILAAQTERKLGFDAVPMVKKTESRPQIDLLNRLSESIRQMIVELSGINVRLQTHYNFAQGPHFTLSMISEKRATRQHRGNVLVTDGQSAVRQTLLGFNFAFAEQTKLILPSVSIQGRELATIVLKGDERPSQSILKTPAPLPLGHMVVQPQYAALAHRSLDLFLQEAVSSFAAEKSLQNLRLRPINMRFASAPVTAVPG